MRALPLLSAASLPTLALLLATACGPKLPRAPKGPPPEYEEPSAEPAPPAPSASPAPAPAPAPDGG